MKKSKKTISLDDTTLNIPLVGSLTADVAMKLIPEIEKYREEEVEEVVFDATELKYIASTGLRAVIYADHCIETHPKLTMVGAIPEVRKIFDMTGISQFITFK